MNTTRPRIFNVLLSAMVGLMAGLGGPARADDTDIYLGSDLPLATEGVRPNVLFVLDTSGSMEAKVAGTGLSRLDNMKNALRDILDGLSNVNVGLMRFTNPGGPVLFPVSYIEGNAKEIEGTSGGGAATGSDVVSRGLIGSDDAKENTSGGAVDLTSSTLALGAASAVAPTPLTVDIRTAADDDDEEQATSGSMVFGSNQLDLNSAQVNGLRFQNVTVPRGAEITDAYIQLTATNADSGAVNLRLWAEATDDAAIFQNATNNISDRPVTTVSADWTPNNWSNNNDYVTPNIAGLVQEVVCRGVTTATTGCPSPPYAGSWASGNAMAFIQGHLNGGQRRAYTHNGTKNAQRLPRLVVTYNTPAGAAGNNVVGLRFTDVGIPKGAVITNAVIEFQAAQNSSDPAAAFEIHAEDADDAVTYTGSVPKISGRTYTTEKVVWDSNSTSNALTEWVANTTYQTPNLKDIVQKVVERSGWCGNNAMAFQIINLSGAADSRVAASRDGNPSAAPVLRVDFEEGTGGPGCINQIVQAQLVASEDDAVQRTSNGSMNVNSDELTMSTSRISGMRFLDVNIPSGTTILEANITFTARQTDTDAATLVYHGEKSANALEFTSTTSDISSRPKTAASVTENAVSWNAAGVSETSANLTPIIQEIVNQSDWKAGNDMAIIATTTTGTRRAKSFNDSPADAPSLRIKVQWGGSVIPPLVVSVRDRLKQIVDTLPPSGFTPIVGTLFEAARYLRGEGVVHGRQRSHLNEEKPRTTISTLASLVPGSGTIINRDAGCTPSNPSHRDCWNEYIDGTPMYKSPLVGDQCQANYIVFLTDGEANHNQNEGEVDHGRSLVQEMVGGTCVTRTTSADACPISNLNCTDPSGRDARGGNAEGELCGRNLATFLHTEDQSSAFPEKQIATLYTIGFNLEGNENAVNFLRDLAKRGGATFKEASTAAELTAVFKAILADVLKRPATFSAPATTVNAFNRLENGLDLYFSVFEPDSHVRWPGNLKKYRLCTNQDATCAPGEIVDANGESIVNDDGTVKSGAQDLFGSAASGPDVKRGGAAEHVPDHTLRKIYTYTGTYPVSGSGIALTETAHAVKTDNTALTKALLGDATMSDDERLSLIDWIRGKADDAEDDEEDGAADGNRFRFGDPMHSSAVVVTYGGTEGAPVQKLFLPTNDGGLRMINAKTGVEEWMFIPQELLPIQRALRENAAADHIYGLDLPPTVLVRDVNLNGIIEPGSDYVRVFIGMRDGGRNYYALDVTPSTVVGNPDEVGSVQPKLLWAILGGEGDFADLERSWSQPVVASIRLKTGSAPTDPTEIQSALIFGGGHDEALDKAFGPGGGNIIYVVNADDGTLITSIGGPNTNARLVAPGGDGTGMDYPIPSAVSALDGNGDGQVDRIYVGDLGGQVWRVDLRTDLTTASSGAAVGVVGKLASLAEINGTTVRPHDVTTRKFYYPPSIVRVRDKTFSSNEIYDLVLLGSGTRQDPLNQKTQDRFYALRDFDVTRLVDANNDGVADVADYPVITEGDLFDITSNPFQRNSENDFVDETVALAAMPEFKGSRGWKLLLTDSGGAYIGEKVTARARVASGALLFTTYTPEVSEELQETCQLALGFSRFYAMDVLTGAALFAEFSDDGDEGAPGTPPIATAGDRSQNCGTGMCSSPFILYPPADAMGGGGNGNPDPDPDPDPDPESPPGCGVIGGFATGGGGGRTLCLSAGLPRIRTYWFEQQ